MSLASIIAPQQHLVVFAALLALCALGIVGEERGWYRRFSGVMVTLLAAAALALLGVLPSGAGDVPAYDFIGGTLMPLAVPLLLFNAALGRIRRECGRLLGAFILAAAGVLLGIGLSALLLDLGVIERVTAALFAATWVGGFMNFMATADVLGVKNSPVFLSAIATDGILNTLLLVILFGLPASAWVRRRYRLSPEEEAARGPAGEARSQVSWNLPDATLGLTVALAVSGFAAWVSPWLQAAFALQFRVNLIVVTVVVLLLANLFPAWGARLHASVFPLGVLLLYLFIAYVGAGIDVAQLLSAGPGVFVFGTITLLVHLTVLLLGGKLLGFTLQELCLASNAAIGGPTTAAPMAVSFRMPSAVTPAILIGLLGYAVGTFLGLAIASLYP